MTDEEIGKIKKEKQKQKKKKEMEIQKDIKKNNEEFKKLSKEEKEKVKIENDKKKEFRYFDKLTPEETERLKTAMEMLKIVVVDPGKRSIMYMRGFNGKTFNYTNRSRITDIKRIKYQKLKENYKKKVNVQETESLLAGYNSKSCDFWKFLEYVSMKININKKLYKFYSDVYFRKLRWFSYLNTKRHEANLMNKIEEMYGEDCIIIIGDWNDSGRLSYMSTPGIGMRRKLAERFTVYLIDEFRTSCLHHKTEQKCDNLYLTIKGISRKMHSVLTCQMNERMGCINRDKNSVLNMIKITRHFLLTGERMEKYRRNIKLEKKQKGSTSIGMTSNEPMLARVQLGEYQKCENLTL